MKLGSFFLQCIALTASMVAASDLYLVSKDPALAGESTNSQYPKSIEINGASFGESNTFSFASGPGKPTFDSFRFSKKLDRSSPNILTYVAMGNNIPTITVYFTKSGGTSGNPVTFRTLTFTNVVLTAYSWADSGDNETPVEEVAFTFSKVSDSYRIQNPNGTLGTTFTGCWAPSTNSPC